LLDGKPNWISVDNDIDVSSQLVTFSGLCVEVMFACYSLALSMLKLLTPESIRILCVCDITRAEDPELVD